jgi:hypothetical protein
MEKDYKSISDIDENYVPFNIKDNLRVDDKGHLIKEAPASPQAPLGDTGEDGQLKFEGITPDTNMPATSEALEAKVMETPAPTPATPVQAEVHTEESVAEAERALATDSSAIESETPSSALAAEESAIEAEIDQPSERQMRLATVQRGSGAETIEGVFRQQLKDNPALFGFSGDPQDEEALSSWTQSEARRIAKGNGYLDRPVINKASSFGHNAYVLVPGDRVVGVDEYVDGRLENSYRPLAEEPGAESEARAAAAETEKPEPPIISEQAKIVPTLSPEQERLYVEYKEKYGLSPEIFSRAGIRLENGLDDLEKTKLEYLIAHHTDIEKSLGVITIADALNADYKLIGDYYYQLSPLEGNTMRQSGFLDVMIDKIYPEGFSHIFGLPISAGQISENGDTIRIKGVAPGTDIIVTRSGGELKFRLKAGLGAVWGENGWTRILARDASLNNENIDKALAELASRKKGS